MKSNYLNIIGLAYRAQKCTTGEALIIKDIRLGKVKLLLIAHDISETTKKKLTDKCNSFHVPFLEVDDRYTLAQAIGKSERVAIAILDAGFAKKITSLLSK
jgi:ribosomal protein L7Ae-like RNA K-turn-binding protein